MPSLQDALVQVGLVTEDEMKRRRAIQRIDDMLADFRDLKIGNATFWLTISHMEWARQPENHGKDIEAFIVAARAQLIARI